MCWESVTGVKVDQGQPGNNQAALENLYEALRFEKCSEYVWKSLGFLYAQQNLGSKAAPLLKKFCALSVVYDNKTNKEELEQVADQLIDIGMSSDAIEIYTKCLHSREQNPVVHLKRALCRCMVGQSSVLYLEDLKR